MNAVCEFVCEISLLDITLCKMVFTKHPILLMMLFRKSDKTSYCTLIPCLATKNHLHFMTWASYGGLSKNALWKKKTFV